MIYLEHQSFSRIHAPVLSYSPILIALLFVLISLAHIQTATAQSTNCPPVAVIDGDPIIVKAVSSYLQARGVSTRRVENCPVVIANLSVSNKGISIHLAKDSGRIDTRLVSDTSTAATLIESWVRSDLTTPLINPQISVPLIPQESEPGNGVDTMVPEEPSLDHTENSIGFAVGLHPGFSVAGDGSFWLSVAATGCIIIGSVCPGTLLRYNVDSGIFGHSKDLHTSRSGIEAVITSEYPIHFGRLVISPGLGIGTGWIRSKHKDLNTGNLEIDSAVLRLEVYTHTFLIFSNGFIIGATLSSGVDPLTHTADFNEPNGVVAGNPLWQVGLSMNLTYGSF